VGAVRTNDHYKVDLKTIDTVGDQTRRGLHPYRWI